MRTVQVNLLCLLLVLLVTVIDVASGQGRVAQRSRPHYAGALPPGLTVTAYLEVCQLCGQFFGSRYSADCVHDKTFATFSNCLVAVSKR